MSAPTAPWPTFRRPLVAILRGIAPSETAAVVSELVDAGFEAIEIPLNSPEPFRSIEIAVRSAPSRCLVGAGTVLAPDQVDAVAEAGGHLIVSPNTDGDVIARAASHGMVTMPGVFSATEAFAALDAGASALKFFPASILGPAGIAAIATVLPPGTAIGAVGGVSDADFPAFARAGIRIFGLGSSLYQPGMTADEVGSRARATVAAYDQAFGGAA